MLPKDIQSAVEKKLSDQNGREVVIESSVHVSGGCINDSCRLLTTAGSYFIKWNNEMSFPKMFLREGTALEKLEETNCIRIPKVIAQASANKFSYLLLEFIESEKKAASFWDDFGRSMACLHFNTSEKFGWDDDNYIGSLPQMNMWKDNWIDFFIELRLKKQCKLAYDNYLLDDTDLKSFDLIYLNLHNMIPEEAPSLLHGDLWSGNFICDENGNAAIVDPAVYFGHREMDLAMSHLFGGFESGFYQAYHESFPLKAGFTERIDLHNLYPLLVHLNLFGMSYRATIRSILKSFT